MEKSSLLVCHWLSCVSSFHFNDKCRVVIVDACVDATGNVLIHVVDVLKLKVAHIDPWFCPPMKWSKGFTIRLFIFYH